MRYHISRKGDPATCNADEGNCPLGGEHFDTPAAAQSFVEGQNEAHLFAPIKSRNIPSLDEDIEANRKLFIEQGGSRDFGHEMGGQSDDYRLRDPEDYKGLKGKALAEKLSDDTNKTWADPELADSEFHVKSDVTSKTLDGKKIYAVRTEQTYDGEFNGVMYLAVREEDDYDEIVKGDIVTSSPHLWISLSHLTDAEGWRNFKGEVSY